MCFEMGHSSGCLCSGFREKPVKRQEVKFKAGEAMKVYPTIQRGKRTFWVKTGEFREPKKGEFYLSGAIPEVYDAPNDLSTKYHIMRQVEEPRCSHCGQSTVRFEG